MSQTAEEIQKAKLFLDSQSAIGFMAQLDQELSQLKHAPEAGLAMSPVEFAEVRECVDCVRALNEALKVSLFNEGCNGVEVLTHRLKGAFHTAIDLAVNRMQHIFFVIEER